MFEFSHRAMACDFVVLVRDESQRMGRRSVADVVLDALESVDAIERRLTVYDAQSEISAVNRSAGKGPVKLSRETFAILQHAASLSDSMGGAFDITAGPLIDAWGFTTRQGRKPTMDEIAAALKLVGMQHLRLDAENFTAELMMPSMRINLGGIGKGDAIDRIAERLKAAGVQDFLIHAGQSSVLAAGDQFKRADAPPSGSASDSASDSRLDSPSESPRGWKVGVSHPTKPQRRIAGIWLRDAALATSGSGKQFFHHRGKRYGHVIDPRTGQPAGDLLSLSVLTRRAIDADALATGLFVMGKEKAIEFAQRNPLAGEPTTSGDRVNSDTGDGGDTDDSDATDDGELPLILVAANQRQDDVAVQTSGRWDWVDPPEGAKTDDASLS